MSIVYYNLVRDLVESKLSINKMGHFHFQLKLFLLCKLWTVCVLQNNYEFAT